jgi:hypothetical protein
LLIFALPSRQPRFHWIRWLFQGRQQGAANLAAVTGNFFTQHGAHGVDTRLDDFDVFFILLAPFLGEDIGQF